ncbi:hypothetical protein KIPB_007381, partial [Kipferlia bialata]
PMFSKEWHVVAQAVEALATVAIAEQTQKQSRGTLWDSSTEMCAQLLIEYVKMGDIMAMLTEALRERVMLTDEAELAKTATVKDPRAAIRAYYRYTSGLGLLLKVALDFQDGVATCNMPLLAQLTVLAMSTTQGVLDNVGDVEDLSPETLGQVKNAMTIGMLAGYWMYNLARQFDSMGIGPVPAVYYIDLPSLSLSLSLSLYTLMSGPKPAVCYIYAYLLSLSLSPSPSTPLCQAQYLLCFFDDYVKDLMEDEVERPR